MPARARACPPVPRSRSALVAGLALGATLAAGTAGAEPARRALLVGVNEYAAARVPDLRGAVNDVRMMQSILTSRFGFAASDIVLLTDAAATRAAVLAAIDQLVRVSQPGDVVYFHYSGHGSQVRDLNGDEDDSVDETILPQDARLPGVPDITDDELDRRFARLRTRSTLLVFDSCHSGTITRGTGNLRARFVPPDDRLDLYRTRAGTTRDLVAAERLPHVVMAGAPADKEALDGPVNENWYGLFTWALAQALESLPAGSPASVVHAATQHELDQLARRLYMRPPPPQLEGPAEALQQPLFGTAAPAAARAWLPVVAADGKLLRLVGGLDLNAQPGSQWAIYAADTERFEFGRALAVGIVERLDGRDALLRRQFGSEQLPAGARAVALAPPVAEELAVRFEGPPGARLDAVTEDLRRGLPALRIVGPGEFARFVIRFDGASWRVLDFGGLHEVLSVPDTAGAGVTGTLLRTLTSTLRATALLALDNAAADFAVELRIPDLPADALPVFRMRPADAARTRENSLVLEVAAPIDTYVTIVSVDTEGRLNLLFPNHYQRPGFLPDGLVRAGQPVRIPDSLAPGNAAGFHWDYGPPAGRDTIRVFAARDLETAHSIRSFVGQAAGDAAQLKALRDSLASRAVRGIQLVGDTAAPEPAPAAGWAAASIVIDVQP